MRIGFCPLEDARRKIDAWRQYYKMRPLCIAVGEARGSRPPGKGFTPGLLETKGGQKLMHPLLLIKYVINIQIP
jgi:hypothetical protein